MRSFVILFVLSCFITYVSSQCGSVGPQPGQCFNPKTNATCCIWCEGPEGGAAGVCLQASLAEQLNCPDEAYNGPTKVNDPSMVGCPTNKRSSAWCNCSGMNTVDKPTEGGSERLKVGGIIVLVVALWFHL